MLMFNSKESLVIYSPTNKIGEETFLQDFLLILKRTLEEVFPRFYMYGNVINIFKCVIPKKV